MTNLQAALGLAQIRKVESILEKKIEIAQTYKKGLADLVPRITLQPEASWAKNIFWMYSILVPKDGLKSRDFLIKELAKKGIESRPFFFPIHRLARFNCEDSLPNADYLAATGINLPSSPNLKKEQIGLICKSILDILG